MIITTTQFKSSTDYIYTLYSKSVAVCLKSMVREFRKWMAWYGKTYSRFELEKGDFLENKCRERIQNAS